MRLHISKRCGRRRSSTKSLIFIFKVKIFGILASSLSTNLDRRLNAVLRNIFSSYKLYLIATVSRLSELFVDVSELTVVVVPGISKGVGFVRFDKRHEAERAIKQLNGLVPVGCSEPITVKFANSPSSVKNDMSFPAALAPYLSQSRRVLGPLHHQSGRLR